MLDQQLLSASEWLDTSFSPDIPNPVKPTLGTHASEKRREEDTNSISQLRQAIIAIAAIAANIQRQDVGACPPIGGSSNHGTKRQRTEAFPFFDLPRELRNRVYHYAWKSYPSLRFPFHGPLIELRYEGYYRIRAYESGYGGVAGLTEGFPAWLLTSRQFYEEAVAQFVLRAEWFADGSTPFTKNVGVVPAWPDTSRIDKVIVTGGNLSRIEPLVTGEGKCHRGSLESMANSMRECHRHGIEVFRKLRVSVYSFELPFDGQYAPCPFRVQKLLDIFHSVNVRSFELEVRNRARDRRRVLFEVRGRKAEEGLKLVVREDEKHPFDNSYWLKQNQWYQIFYHH